MAHIVGEEGDAVGVAVVADVACIVLDASYGAALEVSGELRCREQVADSALTTHLRQGEDEWI